MNCFSFADAEISPLVHARAMPADGELHIWCWTSSDVADDALTTLSADERALHSRFATPELRQRFLASHAGLRNILAGYFGAAARELAFQQTAAGKPYLSGTTLQFNLSHSADANLLAVAPAEVGVDIERVRSLTSLS